MREGWRVPRVDVTKGKIKLFGVEKRGIKLYFSVVNSGSGQLDL